MGAAYLEDEAFTVLARLYALARYGTPPAVLDDLTPRQRQYLKGLANRLEPVVQVGHAGLTEAVVSAIIETLETHELVKIKLGKGFTGDRGEAGGEVAQRCKAQLCQVVGRVLVLYRPRRDGTPTINLPR
ncbi:MAG: ribosome assembly RNA-binding protein YhbY [Nannocystaceae bacterium]